MKTRGGKRKGAGRPSKNRKPVYFELEEKYIELIKANAKDRKVFPSVIIREIISKYFNK